MFLICFSTLIKVNKWYFNSKSCSSKKKKNCQRKSKIGFLFQRKYMNQTSSHHCQDVVFGRAITETYIKFSLPSSTTITFSSYKATWALLVRYKVNPHQSSEGSRGLSQKQATLSARNSHSWPPKDAADISEWSPVSQCINHLLLHTEMPSSIETLLPHLSGSVDLVRWESHLRVSRTCSPGAGRVQISSKTQLGRNHIQDPSDYFSIWFLGICKTKS